MAPRVCALCKNPNRKKIDAFIQTGSPFRAFKKQFRLRSVSQYTYSRHRRHIVEQETIATQAPAEAPHSDSNLDALRRMTVKLERLGARCEKHGRPGNAVAAYAAASRNREIIARNESAQARSSGVPPPVFNVVFVSPEKEELRKLGLEPDEVLREKIREINPEHPLLTRAGNTNVQIYK